MLNNMVIAGIIAIAITPVIVTRGWTSPSAPASP